MSHIPASKMPHAKPHDDDTAEAPHRDSAGHETMPATDPVAEVAAPAPVTPASTGEAPAQPVAETPATPSVKAAPPVHDAPAGVPPAGPGKRPAPGGGPLPYLAFAAVAAVAVGGILAALRLARSKPGAKPVAKSAGKPGRKPARKATRKPKAV